MGKLFSSLFFFLMPVFIFAQSRYTDRIQKQISGWGTIVIHQDSELAALVNGEIARSTVKTTNREKPKDAKDTESTGTNSADTSASQTNTYVQKSKHKLNGYRIQLYAGGNSRAARSEATSIGQSCKSLFPELSVYTHFYPPRWICRVGDFKTYEEAHSYLKEVQKTRIFKEASIIKTQIILYY